MIADSAERKKDLWITVRKLLNVCAFESSYFTPTNWLSCPVLTLTQR